MLNSYISLFKKDRVNILILHFLSVENSRNKAILKQLEQSAVSNGHCVTVLSGFTDGDNFSDVQYSYITLVVPCGGVFSSKLSPKIGEVLAHCRTLTGKKGAALVVKSGFFADKTCKNLMHAMEKEGMIVDYFEVIQNIDHAAVAGKKIG